MAVFACCHGGAQLAISRALTIVNIKQMIARRIWIRNEVMKGASPKIINKKVLLKQINATYRPFGGNQAIEASAWYFIA